MPATTSDLLLFLLDENIQHQMIQIYVSKFLIRRLEAPGGFVKSCRYKYLTFDRSLEFMDNRFSELLQPSDIYRILAMTYMIEYTR